MKFILIAAVLGCFFSSGAFGQSIVFVGNVCEEDVSRTEKSFLYKESRFEVIESLGNGDFKLELTGGLPIFWTLDPSTFEIDHCIDSGDVSLGHESLPEDDFVVTRKLSNNASAYFDGSMLTILVSSLQVTQDASIDDLVAFSSVITPHSFTLLLKHQPERSSFKLLKVITQSGTITSANRPTPPPGSIIELIASDESGLFKGELGSVIEYFLE